MSSCYLSLTYYPSFCIPLLVVAGFITLMNSARIAAGKPLLGFVNPLLYSYNISINSANYASNFYDITSGINSCFGTSATVGGQLLCCVNSNKQVIMTHPTLPTQSLELLSNYTLNPPSQHTISIQLYGFSAVTGWDPVTGLGTINFKNLKQAVGGAAVVPTVLAPTAAPTDTPLYLPVNGVSYGDYMTSPTVFKNQIANAVAYVLTLSSSQVSVTAVAYNSRRTRTRALLGSVSQSVLVQMTVTSGSTSQLVLLSLNNAIGNGLLTTALTAGNNVPSLCPSCITTANVLLTATAVVGTAPTSALTAKPPAGSSSATTGYTSINAGGLFAVLSAFLMIVYY